VGFNESLAVRSLAFNAASQCDAAALRAWACAACPNSTRLVDVNITDAEGHVAYAGYDAARDAVVVVFRGSLSVQDWIDNLDILKVAAYAELGCVGCFVHEGFLKAYEALAPGVAASVTALLARYPGRGVALTGHSLGAAMAAHYALRLRLVDNVTLAGPVYTFGQPRVGDAAFAAWHSALFPAWFRVVHWNDPVPHLPPSDVGFAHEAREIWYDEPSDAAVVCDGSGEDADCSLSVAIALVFDDHCSYMGHRNCQCEPFSQPFAPQHLAPPVESERRDERDLVLNPDVGGEIEFF